MPDADRPRRTLFVLAIDDYPNSPPSFAPGIARQVDEVLAMWSAPELGERRLEHHLLGAVKGRRDVEDAIHHCGLRTLATGEIAVLYITGHGRRSASQRHYLLLPTAPHDELLNDAFPTADIIAAILASRADHVLVIIDSCFSGTLDAELASLRRDLANAGRHRFLAVFTTADFDQRPRVGDFASLLADVRAHLCDRDDKAGYAQPWLTIDEFDAELHRAHKTRPGRPEPLHIPISGARSEPSPCLPNPAYEPSNEAVGEQRRQVATSRAEVDYWLDRASGRAEAHDPGWYFAGRAKLNHAVAGFLRTGGGLLVVTGAAGTGKSAILARAVTLSDAEFRADPRYSRAAADAPAGTVPPTGSIDAAILARNKSTDEIATQLATALGTPQPPGATAAALRVAIEQHLQDDCVRTIVIDGLDEASTPAALITDLLGSLLRLTDRDGHHRARLVIGVRSATPAPGATAAEGHALLDLLTRSAAGGPVTKLRTDGPDTTAAIAAYLRAILESQESLPPGIERMIADAVTPSFLDARFAARRLRDDPFDAPSVLATLRDGTLGLLRDDLHDAATPEHPADMLLAVLRATAFALGNGVPWADIWPAIASAVADSEIPDSAIRHTLSTRLGGYLTRDTADGRTVYRPVHETLAEALRDSPHRFERRPTEDTR